MPSREPLTEDQIESALQEMHGWTFRDDKLHRTFEFADFREAIGFIVQLAFHAEELNHHPELENVYNEVAISLSTHDAGGKVTGMDLELARRIEDIV